MLNNFKMRRMNMLKNKSWMLGLALLAAVGCKKDPEAQDPGGNGGADDKYFIAATADGATYFMTVDDLEKDELVNTGTAIEDNKTFSHFGYNGTAAVLAVNYQQGNAAPGSVYQLSAQGVLKETGDFMLPVGFATIGAADKYLIASRSGRTLTGADEGKTGAIFYFIDMSNNNKITEKTIVTEHFIGDRTAEFSGAVDAGNGEFLVGIKLAAPSGQPAASVDSVYVARLDLNLNVKKIYKDHRLSYSTGEFRSARYSHIANDASGNTYVFSGSHNANTTKKAGALLISKGSDNFDAGYYFDIETASGGYRFKRVYHITEDYFLLEMYNEAGVGGGQNPATQFAVVKMSSKDFKWVRTGFPAANQIDNAGWPFSANGKAYIGVTASDAQPAVYVIDPKTATARKGISIDGVTNIPGLARLSPQDNVQ